MGNRERDVQEPQFEQIFDGGWESSMYLTLEPRLTSGPQVVQSVSS